MTYDGIHAILHITSVVCFILVLIRIFLNGHLIVGIVSLCLCQPVAFIYGWIKAGDWNMQNLMLIWTIALIADAVLFSFHPPSYIPMERLQL
jgi:hypothetical protein